MPCLLLQDVRFLFVCLFFCYVFRDYVFVIAIDFWSTPQTIHILSPRWSSWFVSITNRKADYYRYVAEITKDGDRKKASDTAEELYREATEFASDLDHTHPIRLGLALNYSVFYYEILNNAEKACDIAKGAMDNAIALLESEEVQNSAHDYRDSVLIIQLLKDNFTLWGENQQE